MSQKFIYSASFLAVIGFLALQKKEASFEPGTSSAKQFVYIAASDTLPAPFATPSVRKNSRVIGWPEGKTPVAPAGFTVTRFADKLENPRWIYVADNGNIFVAESGTGSKSANRITLFQDANKDGVAESRDIFLSDLNKPLGMLVLNNHFYVANTDGVVMFDYTPDMRSLTPAKGKKIIELPAGGYNNHWTRNIITNQAKSKLYISVGSGSNVAEHGIDHEKRRANILETNPDGSGERIYAAGLRNPVGMDWAPGTNTLWTAVNERDGLGDDLVPDYITSVKENGFYGWPYAYFGQNEDPRRKGERPDLVSKTLVPDVPVGSHTASLGIAFYTGKKFPAKYQNGAFVGQHGSWNRSEFSGYKVVFVPFSNGKPSGAPEDFLTGFIADEKESQVYGRPVCIANLADGSILITDDSAGTIWRVAASK
ncbi:sorbosone dehydrogenase family protein [Terrimonas sp. NA20]|uniref:Sorbosone dehydrogenase family protein n=1 Tax=Terrimonas ginsenosidimutans TaxID=2908004 RepID=A0ABS9KLH9_9BACT|nr:sorbosone dehydrogenase family protein [Terrimonas ginsenosidimutans]MCG2613183.1 sorbosone dehydrogenase family protein [Terrimonas ginsenosidimutans]